MTYFKDVLQVMMGSSDTILHENRPQPPLKKEDDFTPLKDMQNYIDRQNKRIDNKLENVKNNMRDAKEDLKDRILNEKVRAYERNVHSKVKAFNDGVDSIN